ncbi:MAG: twin-arginine translocase TatA/TatE family subunit [Pseudomonadota bacterium]|nr:twin-arginine translocase TatA/TatE family subunit [Pseudomonadota bacterium]
MLDFSFAELALIVVVAVVFIGPKELPVVVKAVAKALRALRSLTGEVRQAFDELSRESGLKETAEAFDSEVKMIRGDDGKMYEAYSIPPPVGGRLGGGRSMEQPDQVSPHPNPPPTGEGI